MKPNTQSHLCHLPPQIHLLRNLNSEMHFDQHHHHPPQVWKETLSLRMIHIWSLTHIHPEIWSSSSILGHPSGAASSKIVNLIISDHQHHHWNHYHGSDTIIGHPSGAASSKIVYLMISSGAITPGTARYLSAEWSWIVSWYYLQTYLLYNALHLIEQIGPQCSLVNG